LDFGEVVEIWSFSVNLEISRRFWFKREENKERKNMKKDEESTSNDVYDRKLLKNVEEVRFLYILS
jgi:hypothetical protein